ncbi:MAG: hypothetical protein ACOYMN_01360 [Roseimicrobium sp.]
MKAPFYPNGLLSATALWILSSVMICELHGAEPPVERSEDSDEEVLRPAPFNEQERRILQSASLMPVDKLAEIITVYERMSNQAMLDALVRVLVERAPQHPDAVRLKSLIEIKEEVRDPGYLDRLVDKLEARTKLTETEQEAVVAYSYTLSKEANGEEAVRLLALMNKLHFPVGTFNPHLNALATAYRACFQFDDALAVYVAVAEDARMTELVRAAAQRQIPLVKLDKRIHLARQALQEDLD